MNKSSKRKAGKKMKDTLFEIGDEVVLKNKPELGSWTIEDEYRDREGNTLSEPLPEAPEIAPGSAAEKGAHPEALISLEEYNEQIHSLANPSPDFPSFKSYGLTKEQVLEVVMLFMTNMADLHKDLAEEAMADGNYQWATDYFKECQVFLNVKILEDKLYHRFVAE